MDFKTFEKEKVVKILTARDGNGKLWIEGVSVAELLGYSDPVSSVCNHVNRSNIINVYFANSETDTYEIIVFIDEAGLESLIQDNHSKEAAELAEWIRNEVLQKEGK